MAYCSCLLFGCLYICVCACVWGKLAACRAGAAGEGPSLMEMQRDGVEPLLLPCVFQFCIMARMEVRS